MATITIDTGTSIQTIIGWEAVGQSGRQDFTDWDLYKVSLADQTVEDGINRIKINLKRGHEAATLGGAVANDNADAFSINASGFQWNTGDGVNQMADMADMIRTRLIDRNEQLFTVLGFVDFSSGSGFLHSNDAEEYAELIEAAYLHMSASYGWVPDAVEIILEPDHGANITHWTATKLINAILATQSRLAGHGWNPKFLAPSVTNGQNLANWWSGMKAVNTTWLQYVDEGSFHRYGSPSQAELDANQSAVEADGKRLSMLEFADNACDYTILHADLKDQNVVAWEQYTLGYDNTDNGSHYYMIDHTNHTVTPTSRFRYIRQYFKWIRRGAIRKGSSTADANFDGLAFLNPSGKYTVVVKCAASGSFTVGGLPPDTYHIRYTTATDTLVDGGDKKILTGEDVPATIPAVGVLTITAEAIPYPANLRNKIGGTSALAPMLSRRV